MKTFKLQVDSAKVSGTHSDFPAYVDLSEMPTAFWDTVSNGGGDIRCYSNEALTTELPREVVSCDTSTKTGELHVKTGMSTTTTIYITVDGDSTEPASDSTYGSENVWNSFTVVDHSVSGSNSTGGSTGTASGTTATTGKLGAGRNFSTNNDYIDPIEVNPNSSFTIGLWAKYTSDSQMVLWNKGWVYNNYLTTLAVNVTTSGNVYFRHRSGTSYIGSDLSLDNGEWHRFIYTFDGTTPKLYVDGTYINSCGKGTDSVATNTRIGGENDIQGYDFVGDMDEYIHLTSTLSSDYITTEYNNQSDASTFWTITEVGTINTSNFFQLF